jgi:Tol biopolymer transport system component
MSELREVFEMATKEMKPDRDAWKEQERRETRRSRNRTAGAFLAVAILLVGATLFALSQMNDSTTTPQAPDQPGTGVDHGRTPVIVGVDGATMGTLHGLPADARSLSVSPDGRSVLFVADNDGTSQVGTVGIDGTGARFLTHITGTTVPVASFPLSGALMPAWSPDGSQIAFTNGHIWVMQVDGSNPRQLTHGSGVDLWPAWSPDGSTIAYSDSGTAALDDSGFSPTQEIWTVPVSGGSPTRITHNAVPDDMPAYSPSGAQFAFFREGNIWLMDTNGANARPVPGTPPRPSFVPRWSQHGSQLVFTTCCAKNRAVDGGPVLFVHVLDMMGNDTIVGKVESDIDSPQWIGSGNALIENQYKG